MSDLIVCRALLNSGSLSTGSPEVSRSWRGSLSPSMSSRDVQGEELMEDQRGWRQTGMVVGYPPSWSATYHWWHGIYSLIGGMRRNGK